MSFLKVWTKKKFFGGIRKATLHPSSQELYAFCLLMFALATQQYEVTFLEPQNIILSIKVFI